MKTARMTAHQFRYDLLGFLRNRQSRTFTFVLPVVFLVIFAAVFGKNYVRVGGTVIRTSVYYVPGIITFGVVGAVFVTLVTAVTAERESGIYKRRRATPVPPAVLVAGRAAVAVCTALLITACLAAIGWAAYGATLGAGAALALVATIAVAAAAFGCLGYALVSVVREQSSAQLLTTLTTLPLFFVSGVFIPTPRLPHALTAAAEIFPVRHLAHALLTAYAARGGATPWSPGDLAVIAAWGAAGLVVAARRFTWTPSPR